MTSHYAYDRDRLEYELVVRQEPKQARMCGVGGKADRRPIDPPPIVQLRVIDPNAPSSPRRRRTSTSGSVPGSPTSSSRPDPSSSREVVTYAQSYLQNPYYFMFASLAKPDDDAELHWLKDGRTRCTTGSVVSSLYHLKDPQHNNEDAGFFVFPDLSVRTEGSYRLKLSLFEVVGNNVRHCKSIYSAPFYVYTAKKFPGMEESTPLSCSLADQGIKIRIRKDIRVRKRPIQALEPLSNPLDGPHDNDDGDRDGDPDGKRSSAKRSRTEESIEGSRETTHNEPAVLSAPQQSQPWPPVASIDSSLAPTIPPPPNAQTIPPPSGHGTSSSAINSTVPMTSPTGYDTRVGPYQPYDSTQPQQMSSQAPHAVAVATQYRTDNNQQQPPAQQQISPPQAQQQYPNPHHHPPPAQHIPPPPSHMHPPPGTHIAHHAVPPPVQQGYSPYPSQGWGAPPPPPSQPQQQMYDPYAHYHQHPQHPPPPPHYASMPPPPGPPGMHMQHPPPARYDYPGAMYGQHPPPAPHPYAGYYDQPPPPPPPHPHPHQSQHPQQYPHVGTGTASPSNSMPPPVAPPIVPPGSMPPPAPTTPGYVDYNPAPYARGTVSPQPRPYPTHPPAHYGPYPPPPHHQPRHYGHPPPHPYGYPAYPPPHPAPTAESWGNPPAYPPHSTPAVWTDAYSPQQPQPNTTAPVGQPPTPGSATIPGAAPPSLPANGNVGPVSNPGDRIQLAPIRPGIHVNSAASTVASSSPSISHAVPVTGPTAPGSTSSTTNGGYPVIQLTSSTRNGYDSAREDRDDRGERDADRMGGRPGKKNPLSIGSIISNE
ncbi:hypothetical protein AMATHDRAFT_41083 [Amanita thiersii Skay4041]|uniref:Velvet domain-containing protein n=1 Tax=Amanita thiersii Skay4041 TaxID=703135 RepID=A0A2A9NP40_9AGAR|nr:hypothetical protein AMATHDRAFT_41083 [Amanita thiersii Skay4041]